MGDTGSDVRELQLALRAASALGDPPVAASGVFDQATRRAVSRFQQRRQLRDDGAAGPETFAALYEVRTLQLKLTGDLPSQSTGAPPVLPRAVSHDVPTARQEQGPAEWQGQAQLGSGGAVEAGWSGQLALTLMLRTPRLYASSCSDDPHIEQSGTTALSWGPSGGSIVQIAYQFSVADLVTAGRFHLLTPFAGAYAAVPFAPSATGGVQLGGQIGTQVGLDIIQNRLFLGVQGALSGFFDFGPKRFSGDAGAVLFLQGMLELGRHLPTSEDHH